LLRYGLFCIRVFKVKVTEWILELLSSFVEEKMSIGETVSLKVHKIENLFDFDFESCTISTLVVSKY
jgi:hypothetical protein